MAKNPRKSGNPATRAAAKNAPKNNAYNPTVAGDDARSNNSDSSLSSSEENKPRAQMSSGGQGKPVVKSPAKIERKISRDELKTNKRPNKQKDNVKLDEGIPLWLLAIFFVVFLSGATLVFWATGGFDNKLTIKTAALSLLGAFGMSWIFSLILGWFANRKDPKPKKKVDWRKRMTLIVIIIVFGTVLLAFSMSELLQLTGN